MSKKILITLGGNALGNNNSEQIEAIKITAKTIVDLYQQGHKLIVSHGNGKQVGMIDNSFQEALKNKVISEEMPFPEEGAMSQGYIGYHIQNAIYNELLKREDMADVVSLITQVVVDKNDPAFKNPTKPIGVFMGELEAQEAHKTKGWDVKEDSGRGWRRLVPSPKPIDILEKNSIKSLFEFGSIVIAGGGGGIPVINNNNIITGVPAVIDKDFTSAKLAELVEVDVFIILTAVENIIINFGKENEYPLNEIQVDDLQKFVDNNEFPDGSMKPKVEAIIGFVNSTGKDGYIADLTLAGKVLGGKIGTRVYK